MRFDEKILQLSRTIYQTSIMSHGSNKNPQEHILKIKDMVQKSIDRLERDTPNFRLAKDYGLLTLTDKKVIFYFEKQI